MSIAGSRDVGMTSQTGTSTVVTRAQETVKGSHSSAYGQGRHHHVTEFGPRKAAIDAKAGAPSAGSKAHYGRRCRKPVVSAPPRWIQTLSAVLQTLAEWVGDGAQTGGLCVAVRVGLAFLPIDEHESRPIGDAIHRVKKSNDKYRRSYDTLTFVIIFFSAVLGLCDMLKARQ